MVLPVLLLLFALCLMCFPHRMPKAKTKAANPVQFHPDTGIKHNAIKGIYLQFCCTADGGRWCPNMCGDPVTNLQKLECSRDEGLESCKTRCVNSAMQKEITWQFRQIVLFGSTDASCPTIVF